MEERKYTKLKDEIDKPFTVTKVWGFKWQKWIEEDRKFEKNDAWFEGAQKSYDVVTNKGQMSMSNRQYTDMLMCTESQGQASVLDRTFLVKAKTVKRDDGKEVNYYNFRAVETAQKPQPPEGADTILTSEEEQSLETGW